MNISILKNLLVSARNQLNNMLSLNRTKKIKYEEKQYFDLISFLSIWNAYGEEGSKIMNEMDDVPSGDALMQQLQRFNLRDIEEQFNTIFENQFSKIIKKRKKAIAIIDVHEQETYSKQKRTSNDIIGGKHKNGTNFFFKFATIQIIIKDVVLTLGVKFCTRKDKLSKIVKELVKRIKKFVRIKVLLLDRGFRDVNIFNDLEFLDVSVLMPCIKDGRTRKEFENNMKKFNFVKYYWKNSKGEYADFKLIMIKLENGKEIGFYTTLKLVWLHKAKYYLKLYKKRWNIETGYRLQKAFLPKTTCVKGVVRYFYFCYAVAMHNLWLSLRKITNSKSFTVLRMKVVLIYTWITTHLIIET